MRRGGSIKVFDLWHITAGCSADSNELNTIHDTKILQVTTTTNILSRTVTTTICTLCHLQCTIRTQLLLLATCHLRERQRLILLNGDQSQRGGRLNLAILLLIMRLLQDHLLLFDQITLGRVHRAIIPTDYRRERGLVLGKQGGDICCKRH